MYLKDELQEAIDKIVIKRKYNGENLYGVDICCVLMEIVTEWMGCMRGGNDGRTKTSS